MKIIIINFINWILFLNILFWNYIDTYSIIENKKIENKYENKEKIEDIKIEAEIKEIEKENWYLVLFDIINESDLIKKIDKIKINLDYDKIEHYYWIKKIEKTKDWIYVYPYLNKIEKKWKIHFWIFIKNK